MSSALDGKVAVITGGASGMGKATAFRFLGEGASVVVADLNEENGTQTVAEATDAGYGDAIEFVRVDVSAEDDVEAAVARATGRFGRLDVMFNNAGYVGAVGPITDISLEHWNETVGVLLTGVFLGTKHAARAMKATGDGGSIINTASVAGISGGNGPQPYTASKHGVVGLSRSTALELAGYLIRVNVICPGGINTPLLDMGRPDKTAENLAKAQPWPEAGTGDHIASTALWLATDESRFVTGQEIVVDGGLTVGRNSTGRRRGSSQSGFTGITRGSTGRKMDFRPVADGAS